jgi:hypothetical protein
MRIPTLSPPASSFILHPSSFILHPLIFMADSEQPFSAVYGSDLLVLGDDTLIMGTCMLGNAFGQIEDAEVSRQADKEEIENCGGNLRAVIWKKLRFEMTLNSIFDASVAPPGIGDAITIPFAGVGGTVQEASIKWAKGKERMLSIKATYWDALADAVMYTYNTSTGIFTAL